ncbi:hypothetical protein [Mesorhizobium sp. 131-2-5]|uniref:hypothetical protein n=1 Tax=Mesorhizobium sp. 131-2-5 TaxID=2744519 RepID=UPI001928A4F5|nr:hypothetical protein [Mesorhizobium sp. 131-2-5]
MTIVALIAAGMYAADHFQFADRLTLAATAPQPDTPPATFHYSLAMQPTLARAVEVARRATTDARFHPSRE